MLYTDGVCDGVRILEMLLRVARWVSAAFPTNYEIHHSKGSIGEDDNDRILTKKNKNEKSSATTPMAHDSTPLINPSSGFAKSNSSSTTNATPSLYLPTTPTMSPHSSRHKPTTTRSPPSTPPPATTSPSPTFGPPLTSFPSPPPPWASEKVIDNHDDCYNGDKGYD
ncbi:hypothetical protein Vadar_003080 [Vaccinium darrowii]|uniref:Uncharacterized protein n=1 Tax=Vaccinium darrowii TaxID=229202 RepID=A0ACB7ZGW6_9ERIC|nr:hypothetical protein Vadar_003080 [Vaccinium darrowii]